VLEIAVQVFSGRWLVSERMAMLALGKAADTTRLPARPVVAHSHHS
jgi:hypothetical protein